MLGRISLVGAGPGNVELITVKGMRRLKEADVVVYDRLVNQALLSYAKANCELINVGKEPNFHPIPQEEIEAILIEKARENKQVVRLKGGDPYVFGRGGEEGYSLVKQGISFEVVPGITSAIGGLAYAGIPITHRYLASSFHVITAHRGSEGLALNWSALAHLEGTLVFLMGVGSLDEICRELTAHGKSKTTPVGVIHWATREKQQTVIGTIGTIGKKVAEAKLTSPSLIVVGDVVGLRPDLNVFETQSLFGQSVMIPETKMERLAQGLMDAGASIQRFGVSQPKDCQWELPKKCSDTFVFTSKESWQAFIQKIKEAKLDIRTFDSQFISVGHTTTETMEQTGLHLFKTLSSLEELTEKSVTVFGHEGDREIWEEKSTGWQWCVTHHLELPSKYLPLIEEVDVICLPHSKAARDLLAQYPLAKLQKKAFVVMGEQTAKVLRVAGLNATQSVEPTVQSLIEETINVIKTLNEEEFGK